MVHIFAGYEIVLIIDMSAPDVPTNLPRVYTGKPIQQIELNSIML